MPDFEIGLRAKLVLRADTAEAAKSLMHDCLHHVAEPGEGYAVIEESITASQLPDPGPYPEGPPPQPGDTTDWMVDGHHMVLTLDANGLDGGFFCPFDGTADAPCSMALDAYRYDYADKFKCMMAREFNLSEIDSFFSFMWAGRPLERLGEIQFAWRLIMRETEPGEPHGYWHPQLKLADESET
jgi:hypothetical protein